ncbi:hypothetical protein MCEGEM3_02676 [Oxalobacteraceae bacterium]
MTMLRSSLLCGLCLAGFHAFWVFLVFVGWAQPLIDFILELHMMALPLTVQPFQLFMALELVAFAFLAGCFYGLVFYMIGRVVFRGG